VEVKRFTQGSKIHGLFLVQDVSPYWHCRLVCWVILRVRLLSILLRRMNSQASPPILKVSVKIMEKSGFTTSLPPGMGSSSSDGNLVYLTTEPDEAAF